MNELTPSDHFFAEIREILTTARGQVARAVNSAMVEIYWQIGQRIVEEKQERAVKASYRKRLFEELSAKLSHEFGKGFSVANLRNMRQLYQSCPEKGIRYTLSSELGWSHNCLIMREKSAEARQYYLMESKAQNWSVRELQRQIKTSSYQRLLSTQQATESKSAISQPAAREHLLIQLKDSYVLEFLNLSEDLALHEKEGLDLSEEGE